METKAIYKSKTIISAIVGVLLTIGVSTGVILNTESQQISDILTALLPQIGVMLSLAGTIYGRMKAKHSLK